MLHQQAQSEELLELALAENASLQQQVALLTERTEQDDLRIRNLEAMLTELSERLEEVGEQERELRRAAAQPRRGPRMGVAGFLLTAFTRLEFVLDSLEVLANLENPAAALRILVQVDRGELLGKDLESARGWREV